MLQDKHNQVTHVVLLHGRPGHEEALGTAIQRFPALRDRIGGIEHGAAGPAAAGELARGYTHGLALRFADAAALDAYEAHPAHQALVDELQPLVEQFLVLDFPAR